MLRKNSGITLVALIITIIILLILASTATFTGISAIENSRITRFKTEMEMMKLQLNSPSELEKYKKTEDDNLTPKQKSFLGEVQLSIKKRNIDIQLDIDGFKYFTKEQIKDISNIELSRDIYINSNTKTIISGVGVKYNGETYYMLEELPDSLYNVDNNVQNSGNIEFDLSSEKLNITISNIKYNAPYVNKGSIQYKLVSDTNWTTVVKDTISKNFTFEVPSSGEYNIRVIDAKNNESTNSIKIKKTVMEYAKQAMPARSHIDESTNEETGIVMIDRNENEWVWIEVPEEVFETATSDIDYDNIEADLIKYAKVYREGKLDQGKYWTDEWFDYMGTTYDGENEYSQVKYITNSDSFIKAEQYYGTIYKDNEGTEIAEEYEEGTTYYAKITDKINDTSGCGLTYEDYNTNYQKMLRNVYANKGFYIARYEAGIEESDTDIARARVSHTEITYKAVSKKDMIPYNYIYCSEAQKLANDMATGGKTTSLIFGIQWDLVCKFLEVNVNWDTTTNPASYYINQNSVNWGNYNDNTFKTKSTNAKKYNSSEKKWELVSEEKSGESLLTTGASEYTNMMNIYDFAGNTFEWTLEHATLDTTHPCCNRGGSYLNTGASRPSSYRNDDVVTYVNTNRVFRASLY